MPRKSKRIKMMYIEYANSVTNSTETVIKYKFTNAVWFKVGDTKTLATRIAVPDKTTSEIDITVQGLFRQSIYTLSLKPDYIQVIKVQQN